MLTETSAALQPALVAEHLLTHDRLRNNGKNCFCQFQTKAEVGARNLSDLRAIERYDFTCFVASALHNVA